MPTRTAPTPTPGKRRVRVPVIGTSFERFFFEHLLRNRPAIIRGATDGWGAAERWRTADGTPALDALGAPPLGAAHVPVDLVRTVAPGEPVARAPGWATFTAADGATLYAFGEKRKTLTTLGEYAAWWRAFDEAGGDDALGELRYLRDWHCARDLPREASAAYSPPAVFGADWLNDWWLGPRHSRRPAEEQDAPPDDFRFVYMGPAGTWTALHHDVLYSHSWSANVCGHKRWLLFPPSATPCLRDAAGNLVPDVRPESAADRSAWPRLHEALAVCADIVQRPGEIIFVPSGWHHQVHNLDDCISINHNWTSASALRSAWSFLRAEGAAVRACIAELRGEPGCSSRDPSLMEPAEWAERCGLLLRLNAGIDLPEYVAMLEHFADRAASAAGRAGASASAPPRAPAPRSAFVAQYELRQISAALLAMLRDEPDDDSAWRAHARRLHASVSRALRVPRLVTCELRGDDLARDLPTAAGRRVRLRLRVAEPPRPQADGRAGAGRDSSLWLAGKRRWRQEWQRRVVGAPLGSRVELAAPHVCATTAAAARALV